MSLKDKLILLSAPAVVLVEWASFAYAINTYPFDFNQPISTLPFYHPEALLVFGGALTIEAILLAIFALALNQYWKLAFRFTLLCSLCYIITGWSVYNPVDGTAFSSVLHAGAANFAVLGFTFLVYQISQRSHGLLRRTSRVFFRLAVIGMIGVTVCVHVLHRNAAWFQLFVLVIGQAWVLCAAYCIWQEKSAEQAVTQ